jgi:hypothetical protein
MPQPGDRLAPAGTELAESRGPFQGYGYGRAREACESCGATLDGRADQRFCSSGDATAGIWCAAIVGIARLRYARAPISAPSSRRPA